MTTDSKSGIDRGPTETTVTTDLDDQSIVITRMFNVPPEQLVQTFEYEGAPRHVSLETATLETTNSGTNLSLEAVYQSSEDRDTMLETGDEDGAIETVERLAELVETDQ